MSLPNYIDYLNTAPKSKCELLNNSEVLIKRLFGHVDLDSPFAPVIFLVDFSEKTYGFVHKGCAHVLGYSAGYFIEGGLDAFLEQFHEDDFKVLNEKIFRKNLHFLSGIKPAEMFSYIFSYNYRFKNKQNVYYNVLQRFCYLLSQDSRPIGSIGYVSDISLLNPNNKIIHIIGHLNTEKNKMVVVHENCFFQKSEDNHLSKREIEILKWISDGLSSKQIAQKLKISINTVSNHRKNMLQKTNAKNTAELLTFAITQSVL